MSEDIYQSFLATKKATNLHINYPKKPGIYGFFLASGSSLPNLGESEGLIYIGIAKDSLNNRDFGQHFRSGKSGSSTLRRSLGAVLKDKLNLTAIPRGGENDTKRFENYKFTEPGEDALSIWMHSNLEIGYWMPVEPLPYNTLRDEEAKVTRRYLPLLDLDPRTRKYNRCGERLTSLRQLCKAEASRHM